MVDEPQSVSDYRLEQMELEIKALRAENNSLSFGQIKLMFAWLGLPVAVATGVFGLALWQSIEIGTLTAAEQRADRKVSEITEDIDSLGESVEDLASRAQSTIEELREIQGRADGAALALSARANEARQRVAAAENELANLKSRIAAVPQVSSLTASIETAAASLADQPDFQSIVATKALQSLEGIVAAFDLENGCPVGWSEMQEARGRMILGANPDGDLDYRPRPFRGIGGEERVALEKAEMPKHSHDLAYLSIEGDGLKFIDADAGAGTPYFSRSSLNLKRTPNGTYPEGGGEAHNNMPPYIALYFCKKLPPKSVNE